ncbi:DCN1-like protein 5 [Vitis vinifera]|uniref:Defective in cullin neddylation protein n=1 Tax=Vitis vinifera TaxID=29760 RepID=A0A438E7G4_VITVI|nr:DCN1-like protein 5 [Vitis vinifera]
MSFPRKTGSPNPMSIKANDVDLFHSGNPIIVSLFDRLWGIGIEELCSDLKVGADDVRMLMLAWKMKAKKQGFITQDEWRRGLKALEANSLEKLQRALPALEREVMRPSNFKDFYAFAFRYSLTGKRAAEDAGHWQHLSIDEDSSRFPVPPSGGFLHPVSTANIYVTASLDAKEYKVLTFDQWMGFYQFCNEISFPDLNNYDDQLAWPLVLDSFVNGSDKRTTRWIRLKLRTTMLLHLNLYRFMHFET